GGQLAPSSGASPDRKKLVGHARSSIAEGSRSFALASRLLDRGVREHAWLLYARYRACDDLADGQTHGGTMGAVPDAATRLALIRRMTAQALAKEPAGDPAFDGLAIVAAECAIPERYIGDVIEGFALDVAEWRPRN